MPAHVSAIEFLRGSEAWKRARVNASGQVRGEEHF